MKNNQIRMEELHVKANEEFSFGGKRFLWNGHVIKDLSSNSQYSRTSSVKIGNILGWKDDVLMVNGKSIKLLFD